MKGKQQKPAEVRCASCQRLLAKIKEDQKSRKGLEIKCPRCKALNEY